MEEHSGFRPDHWRTQELSESAIEPVDGELVVPDGSGLGLSVADKDLEGMRIA